ncbi:MBL fold metallo-hydrolase [Candidatus Woesearchaeota archaeon]|nr:MBL fold metallo-hydrolase [Candidatus Woesearchaeota archaeon]
MIFEQIPVGFMQNFCYIIADEKSKEAAVVDPGWQTGKILKAAKDHDLEIKAILLTHAHPDHANGVKKIADAANAAVYIHEKEYDEIKSLGINNIKTIKDKDKISIGSIKVEVLHTPGHTAGSVCYLLDSKILTGDTLFVEGIGRTDLPGSSENEMFKSLQKLKKLGSNIKVYPGHDYGSKPYSTIGYEKENNPYMKAA